jgi:hypothetical protein
MHDAPLDLHGQTLCPAASQTGEVLLRVPAIAYDLTLVTADEHLVMVCATQAVTGEIPHLQSVGSGSLHVPAMHFAPGRQRNVEPLHGPPSPTSGTHALPLQNAGPLQVKNPDGVPPHGSDPLAMPIVRHTGVEDVAGGHNKPAPR